MGRGCRCSGVVHCDVGILPVIRGAEQRPDSWQTLDRHSRCTRQRSAARLERVGAAQSGPRRRYSSAAGMYRRRSLYHFFQDGKAIGRPARRHDCRQSWPSVGACAAHFTMGRRLDRQGRKGPIAPRHDGRRHARRCAAVANHRALSCAARRFAAVSTAEPGLENSAALSFSVR